MSETTAASRGEAILMFIETVPSPEAAIAGMLAFGTIHPEAFAEMASWLNNSSQDPRVWQGAGEMAFKLWQVCRAYAHGEDFEKLYNELRRESLRRELNELDEVSP